MAVPEGQAFLGGMMKKFMGSSDNKAAAGFEMSPDMMKMMNGFTVKRILSMLGTMGADAKLTKEDMLDINAKLNSIKKS